MFTDLDTSTVDPERAVIHVRRLDSGYWHIRGAGPCNWAQPKTWPCDEAALRASAFPEASETFIRAALAAARTTDVSDAGSSTPRGVD